MNPLAEIVLGVEEMPERDDDEVLYELCEDNGLQLFYIGEEASIIGISILETEWDIKEFDMKLLIDLDVKERKVKAFFKEHFDMKVEPKLLLYGNYI